jgi:TRAP transporter 4TM/12TM fusion protein
VNGGNSKIPKGGIIAGAAVAWSLFQIYSAFFGQLAAFQQRLIHLSFALFLAYLLSPWRKESRRRRLLLNIAPAALVLILGIYGVVEYEKLWERAGAPTRFDVVLGMLLVLLLLEATRRAVTPVLTILAILALVYAYFGQYFPGPFAHRGYTITRIADVMYLSTTGIFGVPLAVSSTVVAIYIIFAAFLQKSGAAQYFIDQSFALFGTVRGGPAKVAVISSALMGTISGSAVANVVGTGSVTIPMMKKMGYKPHFAGAVEAVASSGGQIMPPVMGAAAFIMAEFLSVPYLEIIRVAVIPAVIYFLAVYITVDREAAKLGLRGLPREQLPKVGEVLKRGWYFLLPLGLLVYFLVFVRYSPEKSAFWALVSIVVLIFWQRRHSGFRDIGAALQSGGTGMVEVALTCGCAGIIIGVVLLTGLGLRLSMILIQLAGNQVEVLLVLTMIASLILGMGLPTSACYIILAILVAPALVKMGINPFAAHLFIFYFGVIANVTPPVALAAFAGAGIAEASAMKTAITASRLAIAAFLVPYVFVFSTGLILLGSGLEIALAVGTTVVGVSLLAIALTGFGLLEMTFPERVLLGASSLFLIKPGVYTDLLGLGLAAFVGVHHWRKFRKRKIER